MRALTETELLFFNYSGGTKDLTWLTGATHRETHSGVEKTCQILLVQTCRMISKHKDMYSMRYLSYTKTDLYGIGLVDPSINQSLWLWLQGGHLLQNTDT